MFLHRQAGEELGQRKVFARELRGVQGQTLTGQSVGRLHHHPWRFAGFHPAVDNQISGIALPNMRRTWERSRQSRWAAPFGACTAAPLPPETPRHLTILL